MKNASIKINDKGVSQNLYNLRSALYVISAIRRMYVISELKHFLSKEKAISVRTLLNGVGGEKRGKKEREKSERE